MELIKPTFEIWNQGDTLEDMWAHIARCTRVCYQSEKKDDKETEEEFVKRVILRNKPWNSEANHLAMLEHGTVYLQFPSPAERTIYDGIAKRYKLNDYSKVTEENFHYYVTTNLRVLIENDWLDDLKYICAPTEYHARRVTVSFTTNIGVTREFNRHRVDSIAEESTRYCNYNKKNNGELNIGFPAWLLDEENQDYINTQKYISVTEYADDIAANDDDFILNNWCAVDFYLSAITFAEWHYNMLIKKGWKPQQAREVLPLATKSQLIHTAFVDDWKHFFKLRADGVSGAPHPNAKAVAKPLKEKFIELGYIKE